MNPTGFCLIRRNIHVFISVYIPGIISKTLPFTSVKPLVSNCMKPIIPVAKVEVLQIS